MQPVSYQVRSNLKKHTIVLTLKLFYVQKIINIELIAGYILIKYDLPIVPNHLKIRFTNLQSFYRLTSIQLFYPNVYRLNLH